jgi:predicted dinucleotide-binding enzyme
MCSAMVARSRVVALLLAALALAPGAEAQPQADTLRIGIIGTGNIGGTLARYWARAGHELVISSRNPAELEPLARELGTRVRAATPREAAAFGDVVLVSVPYGALPQIGRDFAGELSGKIVLDTGNPFEFRDGATATDALERGTGVASAEHLAGTRLVRAFNTIGAATLQSESNRAPDRIAVPIAGDDAEAIAVARRLVADAGFDAVLVGGLERAHEFDVDQPLYRDDLSAAELEDLIASLARCWTWLARVSTTMCSWFF